jgi:hypothetical protein
MLNPSELDHLNRQITAMADYLARRGERLNRSALNALAEAFHRQLRYRQLVEQGGSARERSDRDAA